MTPPTLMRVAIAISGLGALIAMTLGLTAGPNTFAWSTLLVAAGQLAWFGHRRRLARGLLNVTLAVLAVSLSSYLLPEYWVGIATWDRLAERWMAGTALEDWRLPLLANLGLLLLGLAVRLGRRLHLGGPLLIVVAGLLLAIQAPLDALAPDAPHVLDYAAAPAQRLAIGALLLAQALYLWGTARRKRHTLLRPLGQTLALTLGLLLFWQQQQVHEDRRLHADLDRQGRQLADLLRREVDTHLAAMRRFTDVWRLLDITPGPAQWRRRAASYHRDFRYFLNIALIDPDSRVIRVHPQAANRRALGVHLYDSQPSGRAALHAALAERREGRTGVIELLQGGAGIIHYLPAETASGRSLGAVGMVVSLPVLVGTLSDAIDASRLCLELRQGDALLAALGPSKAATAWRHHAPLDITGSALTLTTLPSQTLLLETRARLPVIGLVVGLILVYLLYLVLYAHRRLAVQHRTLHHSHASLRSEIEARTRLQQEVEWLARHDELTGLPNRRLLMESLRAQGERRPLCVMICDLDHFKHINDHLGHLVGDDYLERLGEIGRGVVEPAGGLFARYGGEEFVALLPGCEAQRGRHLAEALRIGLKDAALRHHDGRRLTMSIGLTALTQGPLDVAALMQTADEALYRAKQAGRDGVVHAAMPGAPATQPTPN